MTGDYDALEKMSPAKIRSMPEDRQDDIKKLLKKWVKEDMGR